MEKNGCIAITIKDVLVILENIISIISSINSKVNDLRPVHVLFIMSEFIMHCFYVVCCLKAQLFRLWILIRCHCF